MRPSLLSLSIRPHLRASGMIYTFSSLLLKLLFACTICHRSFIFVSYVSDGVENNGFEPLTPLHAEGQRFESVILHTSREGKRIFDMLDIKKKKQVERA